MSIIEQMCQQEKERILEGTAPKHQPLQKKGTIAPVKGKRDIQSEAYKTDQREIEEETKQVEKKQSRIGMKHFNASAMNLKSAEIRQDTIVEKVKSPDLKTDVVKPLPKQTPA